MVPPFSLLTEAWIPVLRADGAFDIIRPADLTAGLADNPVVAPAWGRADFDAAIREFWIGLLAVACRDRARGRAGGPGSRRRPRPPCWRRPSPL